MQREFTELKMRKALLEKYRYVYHVYQGQGVLYEIIAISCSFRLQNLAHIRKAIMGQQFFFFSCQLYGRKWMSKAKKLASR